MKRGLLVRMGSASGAGCCSPARDQAHCSQRTQSQLPLGGPGGSCVLPDPCASIPLAGILEPEAFLACFCVTAWLVEPRAVLFLKQVTHPQGPPDP